MEQLSLEGLLSPPVYPRIAFDPQTLAPIVALMAEAIVAVFEQGEGATDDERTPDQP
jgi:hypothetical protein